MGERRARRVTAAVTSALLFLAVAACTGGGKPPAPAADANADQNAGQNNNPPDNQPADTGTKKVSITLEKYASCHDPNAKKSTGPSDGLWTFATDATDGSVVTITFKTDKGTTETASGKASGGEVTIRIPLISFGEKIEVTEITVTESDGDAADVDEAKVAAIPEQTVDPTSDCADEDQATADAAASPN